MESRLERKYRFSVVSADRQKNSAITAALGDSSDKAVISCFFSESDLIDSKALHDTDVIFLDRSAAHSFPDIVPEDISGIFPGSLIVIFRENLREMTPDIQDSDVYDVIFSTSPADIKPLVRKIIRDLQIRDELNYLSKEKHLSDHIVNSSRSMLSIINRDYIYEKVNSTFCTAHNAEIGSFEGKALSEVWGEDTFREKIKANIDLCFSGNIIRYEASFNTPGFGSRYYEVVFRPVGSSDGTITHILAETFDITGLKQSQKVVSEISEEFRRLETNLPIGFLRCEPDGAIIHSNRAFTKIIGCDDENRINGLNIKDFYSEGELFGIHLKQLVSGDIKTFGRVPFLTFAGSEIVCRVSGFIIKDESGKPLYIDFAFEDSTRELMLENRLLQAQKLETIGALAGGLAHDFNNILGTILGYSELLLEEVPGNQEISEKVHKIMAAISRARSLTNQILTFSRQVEQQKIPVRLIDVLNETIGFIKSGKPANVEIETRITDSEAMVLADPTQLFRVFLNLMTNGIQAMETEGGRLTISLSAEDGTKVRKELSRDIVADEYAVVGIEDTGVGMEPSVIQRIFEPYFTTKEVNKGTGLGLSVVHGIVAEMDGEIIVKSRKDIGSLFSLYLPVSRYNPPAARTAEGRRIVIVTGNLHESRILSMALEKSGYAPEFATDMKKLFKMLSDTAGMPEAVIYMDDSEEITADDIELVYRENMITTPLVLIADADHYSSREKLLNSGIAKQVLLKPVSLKEIHTAIQLTVI